MSDRTLNTRETPPEQHVTGRPEKAEQNLAAFLKQNWVMKQPDFLSFTYAR
jgi:hypothetical protein